MKAKLKIFILLIAGASAYPEITNTMMLEALKPCNKDSGHDICDSTEECLAIAGAFRHLCVPIAGRKPDQTTEEALKGCNVESGSAICNANEECLPIEGSNFHRCVPIEGRAPSVT
jgi:hypothetical protein